MALSIPGLQAAVAAIKDVIKHKNEQVAVEKDPDRLNRAKAHLTDATNNLKTAEAELAAAVAANPTAAAAAQAAPVGAPAAPAPSNKA